MKWAFLIFLVCGILRAYEPPCLTVFDGDEDDKPLNEKLIDTYSAISKKNIPSDQPWAKFEEDTFESFVEMAVWHNTNLEIIFAFNIIANNNATNRFVKSPNYLFFLEKLGIQAIDKWERFGYELPNSDFVEKAYQKFIDYQSFEWSRTGKSTKELQCHALHDAAEFFLRTNKWGRLQKFHRLMEEHKCRGQYHSWKVEVK